MAKVACLVLRPNGSEIVMPGVFPDDPSTTYLFDGPEGGPHVADVTDDRHLALFASNPHFEILDESAPAPEPAPVEPQTEAAEPVAPASEAAPVDPSQTGAADPKAERDALRARYTELNGGKKPFMSWGADKLRAEIAKLEAQD